MKTGNRHIDNIIRCVNKYNAKRYFDERAFENDLGFHIREAERKGFFRIQEVSK
jgi:hypothetical protein